MKLPDLFGAPAEHEAGGKVKTRMPPGMIGKALFRGPQNEHRIWLYRGWGQAAISQRDLPYALLVGMNPSTADADFNDPTIGREIGFVAEWGFSCFYKGNVGSYRATNQRELLNLDIQVVHPDNIPMLRALANEPLCQRVVLCCGKVPVTLLPTRDQLVQTLRADGHTVWCFGLTDSGHPCHPLYLAKGTPLIEYVT